MGNRNTQLKKVLGTDEFERIRSAEVLLVGAGGIGCELLKNIVLMGYGEIHIVDLDTITLSNLNRQFLFRQKDIKKSKSLTVVKAVEPFNFHGSRLVAYHGNIMDTKQFPLVWFEQFTLVFNALDNVEARTYVNKMCLFLNKPLMESGTTGYDGHVQPIYGNKTECFDCTVKETPKTFPVCTIRSTPSQPVHCITWAKNFLFQQLFDESESQPLNEQDLNKETDDQKEIDNLLKETNELNELRGLMASDSFLETMIDKIFKVDIERLLEIDSLWKTRAKPTPFEYEKYNSAVSAPIVLDDTNVWTIEENLALLVETTRKLQHRLSHGEPFLTFDKDDEDTLDFVVTASNLRSFIFGIEIKSKFDIKQIAGNIIPAIATTNAIIAGFSALQSLNLFNKLQSVETAISGSKMIFTSSQHNRFVSSSQLFPPNEACGSCSVTRGVVRFGSVEILTVLKLRDLVEGISGQYGYGEISLVLGKNKLIYDFDFDDNLDSSLASIGFKADDVLLVNDEDDELESIELYIQLDGSVESFKLPELSVSAKKSVPSTDEDQDIVEVDNDDELEILDEAPEKRSADQNERGSKRLKTNNGDVSVNMSYGDITVNESTEDIVVIE